MTIVSLIVAGDSLSAHTAPYFTLVGVANVAAPPGDFDLPLNMGPSSDTATGANNRIAFIRTGTNPALLMVNASNPGTHLGTGSISGETYAPLCIDPLIRGSSRLFIISMFYSNLTTAVVADAVAGLVTWFNERKAAAALAGARLACMTVTLPSRTDGTFSETMYRVPYNNTIVNPSWQAANGVYVADLTGIPEISAVNAANNTTYFVDTIHWTFTGASLAVAPIRNTINQIISDFGA